jgi:endonuclease/exonuclease/phosphatase family metal-dependent hydrolase
MGNQRGRTKPRMTNITVKNTKKDTTKWNTKSKMRIGTWNVRTLNQDGKPEHVARQMLEARIDILGMAEVRHTSFGEDKIITKTKTGEQKEVTFLHSGTENEHKEGVGLIMSQDVRKTMIKWEPVNSRIITARFQGNQAKVTIIQVYAPTNERDDTEKDSFYQHLQDVIDKVPHHDVLIVMGDFNAKVGDDNSGYEEVMGKHGLGTCNENGKRLLDCCMLNNFVIGGTIFPHKNIHKYTWTSPDSQHHNQIDHIMIRRKWRRSLQDVRTYKAMDNYSDHECVLGKFRVVLKRPAKGNNRTRAFNTAKLQDNHARKQFQLQLKNKFSALNMLLQKNHPDDTDKEITSVFHGAAKECLGYRRAKKEEWISDKSWSLMDERGKLKVKSKTQKNSVEYKEKHKEVKKSIKNDKETFINAQAQKSEEAFKHGDLKTVYQTTKAICNKPNRKGDIIKDKDGKLLTTEREQAARWIEHFEKVLNQPEPNEVFQFDNIEKAQTLKMKKGEFTVAELRQALKQLRNGKAAGEDGIAPEMLKHCDELSELYLLKLCNEVWNSEKVPSSWRKGVIVKLPKKGDLRECGNWRGITLLPLVYKLFFRMLINRIKSAVDSKIGEQQAGFRSGRSCADQIFTLRYIIEQCLEWQQPLLVNFIDFEKAFDSLHRETLWKILEVYGFPSKVINIIRDLYEGLECCIKLDNGNSDWFSIRTGVRQGCVLSPMLFGIAVDFVMKQAQTGEGLKVDKTVIEELAFADDFGILSCTSNKMQNKTTATEKSAGKVGLRVNIRKTEVMRIGQEKEPKVITVGGEKLREVTQFVYLGSTIKNNGSTETEIKTRIGKAAAAFNTLHKVWKNANISLKTKIRLLNSNVLTVLLYGCETWKDIPELDKKLASFHQRCLRRILRIKWQDHITNETVLQRTQQEDLKVTLIKRRLQWLGHVMRMNEERYPKMILNWHPEGFRRPGRPKTTYINTMQARFKEKNIKWPEVERCAQDRRQWKCCVALWSQIGT